MRNYECLRGGHAYERDIYAELRRIEERGKRMKMNREPLFSSLFGLSRKERQEDRAALSA